MRIHFIGCEGASMKVLMKIAEAGGAVISGSDLALNGHSEEFVKGADLVVYSSAIPADNPEIRYAEANGIKLVSRAEFLGSIAAKYDTVIAVAGSHGKTTCTAMLGSIFAPLNVTVHLGGEYAGECGHVGGKHYFITEACEYKRNFLHLFPRVSVVLNVELDHTDYYRDLADITSAFSVFSHSAPVRIVCGDDEKSEPLRDGKYISFGLGKNNDYRAENILQKRGATSFILIHAGRALGEIELRVMGRHNVYNALAAAAVSMSLGLGFADVKRGLESFTGASRRMELIASAMGCDIYSDYAHHPHEIESTVNTLREAGYERITLAFEPHTYSRTASLADGFVQALVLADDILLAEIYPAREQPVAGVSSQMLCRKILQSGKRARCFSTFFELNEAARKYLIKNSALVFCGAGTIDIAAREFCAIYR